MECNEDEYIYMDLDSLFKEADELGILKTLQMMHLCSHKLELDIKSLVTSELDSVLLCVTTILEICTLIKNSRTNLDNIGALIRSFGFYEKFSLKEALDEPLSDSCLQMVSEWLNKVTTGETTTLDIEALMANIPDKSKFLLASMAMEALQSTSMKNYRLLKANKLLQSYNLLHVKSPALMAIINGDHYEHYGMNGVMATMDQDAHNDHHGLHTEHHYGMERLSSEGNRVEEFVKRTRESIQFHTDKLESHCLAVLDSSDVELILEALSTLVLLYGNEGNLDAILERRIKLYKIAIHSLQVGSFRSLESLMLQYIANYAFISAFETMGHHDAQNEWRRMEPQNGSHHSGHPDEHSGHPDEHSGHPDHHYGPHHALHSSDHSGEGMWRKEHMHTDLFATILKKHLAYYSLNELGPLYNKLLDYPMESTATFMDSKVDMKGGLAELHKCISETFKKCAYDKISKYIFAISSTICKPVNISVESLYNVNSNYMEYFSYKDFIANDQEEIGTSLDTLFGDLYTFVDSSRDFRDEFALLVHEKLSQLLNVINTHVKSLQIKEPSDDSIMLMDEETDVATLEIADYLFDGVVHKFLSSNKLVGLILSLGKFPEPLLSQVYNVYRNIARNLLEPIVKHTEMTISSLPLEDDDRVNEQGTHIDEKGLYAVMIVYASFNIKCMVRVENLYRDSEFSKVVHQSALEMAFGLYKGFESLPSQLQVRLMRERRA